MKLISYVLTIMALGILGYVFLQKNKQENIEKEKFLSNIKAGRKSFDEANWMSPLSVRENDSIRFNKDSVIDVRSGKVYANAALMDTSHIFLNFWHKGTENSETQLIDIEQFYLKYKNKIRFLVLSNDSLTTARKYLKNESLSVPFYVFKNGRFPADLEVFPISHLKVNRKTAFYYAGIGYFDNKNFYSYIDSVLAK
ncbi:hypothetical protein EMA8858_03263 [Emticicia aquatica]|uniref:Uncharacterized protein n=1 Tax=Emticicia aquatica TaxID=1681835 RepID=A0ABN8EWL3_9BACT|nr:hypothetical protein [Emticicia aquatica]CAH0997126.1 hypothetical protein EMA8858_03263 [Emticicia aquatica]